LNHCFPIFSLDNGKYSFATVSLYQNGEILAGKNSHHSQVVFICSIILGTSVLYSSFVYCLFSMQYDSLFFNQTHQKQLVELFDNVSE
jgi:hypothetical protein